MKGLNLLTQMKEIVAVAAKVLGFNMISVTDSAVAKVSELLAEENNPKLKLRTFVQGGGCSGFQYGFTFDEEQNEDDFVIDRPGMSILIDSMSMQYMQGAIIDYKEDIMGSSFTITNPNAESTCGCGSSFSV
jgi:iron-sulfur cluster insertion protein